MTEAATSVRWWLRGYRRPVTADGEKGEQLIQVNEKPGTTMSGRDVFLVCCATIAILALLAIAPAAVIAAWRVLL